MHRPRSEVLLHEQLIEPQKIRLQQQGSPPWPCSLHPVPVPGQAPLQWTFPCHPLPVSVDALQWCFSWHCFPVPVQASLHWYFPWYPLPALSAASGCLPS
uniref:Uncharacterized protein n=1 Tax=Arundo donax TaxID=35708 RepID=A0A0A9DRY5_ARUDO